MYRFVHNTPKWLRDRPRAAAWALPWLLGIAAVPAAGCEDPPTQLVVLVDTDYEVPAELAEVESRILRRQDGGDAEQTASHIFALTRESEASPTRFTVPFSFGVVPARGDPDQSVAIEVEGRAPGTRDRLVTRRAVTGFLPNKTLQLKMFLTRACEDVKCDPGFTCTRRGCVDEDIPPEELEVIDPGEEFDDAGFDAFVPFDAGPDAATDGGMDAAPDGPMDGSTDAGADANDASDAARDARTDDGGTDAGDPLFMCSSGCDGGCTAIACEPGTACECHEVSCNCELQCPDSNCQTSCRRSDCVVRATDGTIDADCLTEARCEIDARGADATATCQGGSECIIDCRNADRCEVDCRPGASCRIRCTDAADCHFATCTGTLKTCEDGWRTCQTACP